MSTLISCAGSCSLKLNCPDDKDPSVYAVEQNWTSRFNPFAEKGKKDEYRCKACSELFANEQLARFGFSTRPQTATTAASTSKTTAKPTPKPEPPPRGFKSVVDPNEIGKIMRERFT